MRTTILLYAILCSQFALPYSAEEQRPPSYRAGPVEDQFLHWRSMTILRSTFFKKRARHNSLPRFLV